MRKPAIFAIILAFCAAASWTQNAPAPRLVPGTGHYDMARYLSIRSSSLPSYSPVGEEVVYLSNLTGTNQVWKMQARGGYPEQLTFFDDRVQEAAWSPRSDVVLFTKDQGGDERSQLYLMDPNGENIVALTSEPKVIHAFGGFSRDGKRICYSSNARSERYFDVYVMDLATRQSRRLLSGDDNYYAQSFSPDGRYLLATRERSNFDNDLFLVDTRSESVIHLTPHTGEAFYRDMAWAPDSAGFYLAANQGRDKSSLAYFDIATKKLRYLEDSDFELDDNTGIAIDPGGKYLFYAWNDNGASLARLRDLKTGKVEIFRGLPRGLIGPGSFNGEGTRVAFSYASPAINQDVWVLDVRNNQAFQLSHSTRAGIPSASFVEPAMITYTSFDGTKVPAFLFTPRDAGAARLPAIVLVHGGPESEQRASFSSTIQYFVNRGYVVLAPNIRGSSGFGTKYLHMDDYKKRPDAIADVSAAADYLKSLGGVDPKKLVIMGGSYGGFMTLAQATMHPEYWAAAVDIVGIANWATFFKSTGAWRRANRAAEYGDPDKDPEFMASISPINHVEKIRAPLFVIAGANDPRVPKNEADQIVEKVRARGVPVEYISFPDEGHGMAKRANQIRGYSAIADFLDKYVKNAAPVSAGTQP